MKNILCYSFCLLFSIQQVAAQIVSIKSPDNKIVLNIKSDNGQLLFNVKKGETTVLEDSPMAFSSDEKKFIIAHLHSPEYYKVDETYPIRGIHSLAINKANGMKVKIADKKNNTLFAIDARAYNDGIAFRFLVKGTPTDRYIPKESTVFKLPLGSYIYYHDMYAHYEGIHKKQVIDCVSKGEWAAPPVTIELPQKQGYACITESALRNYPGMSLQADGECGLVVRLGHEQPAGYPFAHDYSLEEAKRLSEPAVITGDIITPWRTVIITSDLNELVNTDLITNLSPAPDKKLFPEGVNTEWIKPGRSVWCWLDGGQRTLEGMKEFSKLAGELGFEYNTVDAFWYRWTDMQIKELVDYSAQFGVKIWLWRHGRDLRDPQKRKEFFDRCQRLGIVGVKLDAFSHESKEFIDLYQACLKEAAEHKLMLNIHGSDKPTGEVRSWPNEMSREGIRGLEYGKNQYEWATHNTTLPFTRLVAGAGDYTPMVFGDRKLDTSWVHQIATALIFNSSVIFFGAHPQTILDNPAVDIIKDISAVWDETIVLPCSEIGKIAAFARRSGDTWFLAVVNGKEAQTIQFPLSFLGEGWYEATVLNDRTTDAGAIKIERAFCRNSDSLTGYMRNGGGYIVRFKSK